MPTPHKGEGEQDFVSRCMAHPDMQQYDQEQRAAICYSMFREQDKAEAKRAWYRFAVDAAAEGSDPIEANLYVYDSIGSWGFESGVTAKQFIVDLKALPKSIKTIKVHINSPGGSVFDALAIANALRSHKATVGIEIEGLAASAATLVAMAGDTIKIAANALMMVHEAQGFVVGGARDMRAQAEALDRVQNAMVATYQWHSGLSAEELGALMAATTWLSAEEALKAGFATEITPASSATAHVNAELLARAPVPERFAALIQNVEVPVQPIVPPTEREAISPQKANPSRHRGKKMAEEEPKATPSIEALNEAKTAGVEEGAKAERERILGIERAALPGHDALVAEMKADGKTTPGEAALRIAEVEKAQRQRQLEAIRKDGLAPAPPPTPSPTGDVTKIPDESRPLEERAKAEWERSADIRDEFDANYDRYLAWRKAEAQGQARILRVVR